MNSRPWKLGGWLEKLASAVGWLLSDAGSSSGRTSGDCGTGLTIAGLHSGGTTWMKKNE